MKLRRRVQEISTANLVFLFLKKSEENVEKY